MDPLHQSAQQPPKLTLPTWYDRLLMWSGWESVVEYRGQVITGIVCLIAGAWLIGWWLSRSESSSVSQTLRAEVIVERLRSPGATPQKEGYSVEKDAQQLALLASVGTPIGDRFSGVVAEEELLAHTTPLVAQRFDTAVHQLTEASLPLQSTVVRATLLANEGQVEQALNLLDELLGNSALIQSDTAFPQLRAYALLQKAAVLHGQKKPNSAVIDELHQWMNSHPQVEQAMDSWVSGESAQLIDSLRLE